MMILKDNGRDHEVDAESDTPLLYVLRDDLALNAAKFGCGLGQCGACTVIVDGKAVLSCVTPMILLEGKQVTTLEGLGPASEPAPIDRRRVLAGGGALIVSFSLSGALAQQQDAPAAPPAPPPPGSLKTSPY